MKLLKLKLMSGITLAAALTSTSVNAICVDKTQWLQTTLSNAIKAGYPGLGIQAITGNFGDPSPGATKYLSYILSTTDGQTLWPSSGVTTVREGTTISIKGKLTVNGISKPIKVLTALWSDNSEGCTAASTPEEIAALSWGSQLSKNIGYNAEEAASAGLPQDCGLLSSSWAGIPLKQCSNGDQCRSGKCYSRVSIKWGTNQPCHQNDLNVGADGCACTAEGDEWQDRCGNFEPSNMGY